MSPNPTTTTTDLDFKVLVLFFYLIDKHKFRRAILSGDRSCYAPVILPYILKTIS